MRIPREIFKHPLLQQARKTLRALELPLEGSEIREYDIIIALSGGADSVALLRVMLLQGFRCTAAHCNFHLRGKESDDDQRFVEALCQKYNVPLHIASFATRDYALEKELSVEEAARDLRYAFFSQLSCSTAIPFVATAHHLDDNIETLIQHLAAGCGIAGLRGIPPKRGIYIRPLIDCPRADIIAFLALLGQNYCTDSTNSDTAIRRNFIRHELRPLFERLNPSFGEACQRTLENLRETEKLTEYALRELIENVKVKLDGSVYDARKIAASPAPLSLLHAILAPFGFSRIRLKTFVEKLTEIEPAIIESKTHRVLRRGGKLHIVAFKGSRRE